MTDPHDAYPQPNDPELDDPELRNPELRNPELGNAELDDSELDDSELPALTEAEERQVAALLGRVAAGSGPMTTPPAVVARLEGTLAGLVAGRTDAQAADDGAASRGAVIPLVPAGGRQPGRGSGQRRTWLARTLLAAAAVVVGGYAVGNLADDGTLAGGASGAGGGSAESAAGADAAEDGSAATGGRDGSSTSPRGETLALVPTVRPDRLAADVRQVVRLFGSGTTGDPAGSPAEQGGTTDEVPDCPVPRLTEEQRLYQIRFRGELSGLVVGPPQRQRVEVTIYSCSTGGVQLARTVPTP